MSGTTAAQTHHVSDAAPRVPISLRLPPQMIAAVDQFAASNHLTKTDAFVFFVNKGMDGFSAEPQVAKLDAISARLERIEELLAMK